MGQIKIIRSAPWMSIQDKGRFGCRRYGIPQSGAMDLPAMQLANRRIGNEENSPVMEFALGGIVIEAISSSTIGVAGVSAQMKGKMIVDSVLLNPGDQLEVLTPYGVFGYLALAGGLQAQQDFDSFSTYEPAAIGGIEGRNLAKGDILESKASNGGKSLSRGSVELEVDNLHEPVLIRVKKGPEFRELTSNLEQHPFTIQSDSNRMGVRLKGKALTCQISEIESSAVIPGIIQLPSNGQPVVLMNDCQTIGGYPRIAKVLDEDLPRLAQMRPGRCLCFRF